MKKIIVPLLVLGLFPWLALAAEAQDGKETQGLKSVIEAVAKEVEEAVDWDQQVENEEKTQNAGEEKQIRTENEERVRNEENATLDISEGEEIEETATVTIKKIERAQTVLEAREIVRQVKQVMEEELEDMEVSQQRVYQNQNKVREAVHALVAVEDLVVGAGSRISQIASDFATSVQITIVAEEKIQERSAIARFFVGGDAEAAEEIEQQVDENEQRIRELKELKEECDCDEEVGDMIQEQIQNMEEEQTRLREVAETETSAKGIFGWIRNLFE